VKTGVCIAAPSLSADEPWQRFSDQDRRRLLFILWLLSASSLVDRSVIAVLLEPIKAEFQVSDTMLGILTGIAFGIFYATLGIPIARWADRGNRKVIITLALVLWSVMTTLSGLAQSFWQLALARVGLGVGEAGANPPAQSLLIDYFPPERRGRALAIWLTSGTAGSVLGFVLGAQIAARFGWRMAFVSMGLPGLALAGVAARFITEPRSEPGVITVAHSAEPFRTSIRSLWAKPAFLKLLSANVLFYLVAYGVLAFGTSYIVRVLGVKLAAGGTAYGLMSAASGLVGLLVGGFLTDRLAKRDIRWLAWAPAVSMLVSLPLFECSLLASTFAGFLAWAFCAGVALNTAISAFYTTLHAICGSERRATTVAIVLLFTNLVSLGVGPVLTGALSDAFTTAVGVTGLRYALMIGFVVFIPAALCMFGVARTLQQDFEP